MAAYTTACPRNCYSTCSMRVHVENGRLVRIEAHPGNRASAGGVCLKGLSYIERVVSPDRLLHPLRRRGRGPEFERISWPEALDLISRKLLELKRAHGPQSVFYYAGSGTKGLLNSLGLTFWRLFGGCTTTYGDLCWPAGLEATRLTLGKNEHNAPWDLANARLIVLWGKNPAETNIHQMAFIEQALERGARLIVVDPRRTESAERAELLVQPRPGSDGALALGVANRLIETGSIDREFIAAHVLGFEEFARMVRGCTPEWTERATDVPARYVERLAAAIGGTRPMTIIAGFGMQRYTNSGQTMRALIALPVITGNIGRPGAGWQFADLQSHIFDAVRDPLAFYPPAQPGGPVRVSVSTARLGRDMPAARDPALKMAWVERGNPVTQNPETHAVLRAFRSLEFRVVIDQFMTDTAREADLILPAKSMFEQSDVIGAYWHPYIQLKQKVLEPPGEVKPESEIYALLAARVGIPAEVVAENFPGTSDGEIEAWLQRKLEPFAGLSLERLRQGPVPAPGWREIAFDDFVFPTPSGKIELFSREAHERWGADPLPAYHEPDEFRTPRPEGARFPLYFLTPNTKDRIHSQFGNLRLIREVSGGPQVLIHPQDARSRGIADGEMVRVFNSRGAIRVRVRLDYSLKRGCVCVHNGWWLAEGGGVNCLSLGRETDMGHGAAFHDTLVEVEKA